MQPNNITKTPDKQYLDLGYTEQNSVWTKSYQAWPIVLAPEKSFTTLCVGFVVIDEHMKQLHVVHPKNFEFLNRLFKIDREAYDLSWAISVFIERLKQNPDIEHHLQGDDFSGTGEVGSGLHLGMPNSNSEWYSPTFYDTEIRTGETFAIDLLKNRSFLTLESGDLTVETIRLP